MPLWSSISSPSGRRVGSGSGSGPSSAAQQTNGTNASNTNNNANGGGWSSLGSTAVFGSSSAGSSPRTQSPTNAAHHNAAPSPPPSFPLLINSRKLFTPLVVRFDRLASEVRLSAAEVELYHCAIVEPLRLLIEAEENGAAVVPSARPTASGGEGSPLTSPNSPHISGSGHHLPPLPRPRSQSSPSPPSAASPTSAGRAPTIAQLSAAFGALLRALSAHRDQTVRLLSLCAERERIVKGLFAVIDDYKSRRMTTLDLQTALLQGLYAHQVSALGVVEGIAAWRRGLTRDYPFIYGGGGGGEANSSGNAMLAILEDCDRIEAAGLSSVMPLLLQQYPLCSNMAQSLALFAPAGAGQQSASAAAASPSSPAALLASAIPSAPPPLSFLKKKGGATVGGATNSNGALPPVSPRRGAAPSTPRKGAGSATNAAPSQPSTPRSSSAVAKRKKAKASAAAEAVDPTTLPMAQRLLLAEQALMAEALAQLSVARGIAALGERGLFVPILKMGGGSIGALLPGGKGGAGAAAVERAGLEVYNLGGALGRLDPAKSERAQTNASNASSREAAVRSATAEGLHRAEQDARRRGHAVAAAATNGEAAQIEDSPPQDDGEEEL